MVDGVGVVRPFVPDQRTDLAPILPSRSETQLSDVEETCPSIRSFYLCPKYLFIRDARSVEHKVYGYLFGENILVPFVFVLYLFGDSFRRFENPLGMDGKIGYLEGMSDLLDPI
jgi:hypothetical protein